jgi:hypothetical protein
LILVKKAGGFSSNLIPVWLKPRVVSDYTADHQLKLVEIV